ncbi:MAG: helix-turn-helix domain-containing protein [Verrucomicrobiota bacterium]
MLSNSPTATDGEVPQAPQDLHTAEEIAEVLKVDPKTVLNWAKAGIIPEAFRVGRTVRFSLEAVKASLNVNCAGEGRSVELAALALKLVFGDDFPRLTDLEPGSITMDEMAEIERLRAIHTTALEGLKTPQERFAYTDGALTAATLIARDS